MEDNLQRLCVVCPCKDSSEAEDTSSPHSKVLHRVLLVMGGVAREPADEMDFRKQRLI